jgi:hypothetical protein
MSDPMTIGAEQHAFSEFDHDPLPCLGGIDQVGDTCFLRLGIKVVEVVDIHDVRLETTVHARAAEIFHGS